MRAQERCGCGGRDIGPHNYRDYLMEAVKESNKTGKTHVVAKKAGKLVIVRDVVAYSVPLKYYAIVPPGITRVDDVERVDDPFRPAD